VQSSFELLLPDTCLIGRVLRRSGFVIGRVGPAISPKTVRDTSNWTDNEARFQAQAKKTVLDLSPLRQFGLFLNWGPSRISGRLRTAAPKCRSAV